MTKVIKRCIINNVNNEKLFKGANMLIEEIKESDLWIYFRVSGSLVAIQEIVKRHNRQREQIREKVKRRKI